MAVEQNLTFVKQFIAFKVITKYVFFHRDLRCGRPRLFSPIL